MKSEIRYAKNPDGQSVAYQTVGEGSLDLVFVPQWLNLEVMWEEPRLAAFFERMARFARVICFDKRGTGLSDPVTLGAIPTPEDWMYDVATVMDAADSRQAAIFGHGDGATMALLFAATHPDRASTLILADAYARRMRADDYPCGVPEDVVPRLIEAVESGFGAGEAARLGASPSLAEDESFIAWQGRFERLAMSPGQFNAVYPLTFSFDLRWVLPTIRMPTLVLHRAGNRYVTVGNGRYLAEHIEGAQYVEIPGDDYFFQAGDTEAMLGPVEEFLTGRRAPPEPERVLATVLFTDIVGATAKAETLGDGAWRELLERHHSLVRRELAHFGGREIDTAGDGFLASFEGPARGVRCAMSIREALRTIGVEIRAGLHTGECERSGDKLAGIAVHIGARVAGLADPGEVLVSRTVKDLVAGSGLAFVDRGVHELKGVSESWQLFRAEHGHGDERT
jgi:class 3 adenylate cyclase